jgi:hypothetical protein
MYGKPHAPFALALRNGDCMAKKTDPKIPTVTLGGKEWKIPPLAVRQLREVRAPMIEMNRRLIEAAKSGDKMVLANLDRDDFDRLVIMPVYWGLTKAAPELAEDEFLDMDADEGALIDAWFVVRRQSGLFIKRGDAEPGEATAVRTKK